MFWRFIISVASERLGAHVLQIPYKGNDISMFILLPPFVSPNGMEYMLSKLNGAVLAELVEPGYMVERPVDISVPKFEVEQELKLVPVRVFITSYYFLNLSSYFIFFFVFCFVEIYVVAGNSEENLPGN